MIGRRQINYVEMARRSGDGRKEREIKRIKMWYVRGPVPHHECIYYVSQSFTILKIFPCDQGIQC